MAVPVLIGIPALISSIVTWATSLAAAFVAWIAQRGVINSLWMLGSLAIVGTFIATIDGLIATATGYVSGYAWGALATSILPDTTATAIGICLSADVARWLHDIGQSQLAKKFT